MALIDSFGRTSQSGGVSGAAKAVGQADDGNISHDFRLITRISAVPGPRII
jgi:hypothetical protein